MSKRPTEAEEWAWAQFVKDRDTLAGTANQPTAARYVDPEPCVTYSHKNDKGEGIRFRQYKKDPLPSWAVDVQDEVTADPTTEVPK